MAMTVVFLGNNFVAEFSSPSFVIYLDGETILNLFTSPEFTHAMSPSQYSFFLVDGVPPSIHY